MIPEHFIPGHRKKKRIVKYRGDKSTWLSPGALIGITIVEQGYLKRISELFLDLAAVICTSPFNVGGGAYYIIYDAQYLALIIFTLKLPFYGRNSIDILY